MVDIQKQKSTKISKKSMVCLAAGAMVLITFAAFSINNMLTLNSIRVGIHSISGNAGINPMTMMTQEKKTAEEYLYPQDDPQHPWNWARRGTNEESLAIKKDCGGRTYQELYDYFHENGYVIFKSCTLKESVLDEAGEYTKQFFGQTRRKQDAKIPSVRDIALDPDIMDILAFVHGGRRPFPFQTLNFPVGTEQGIHSDLVHFDTFPRTHMSAAWTALEDINENNGPLRFYPKSHKYGIWDPDEVGLRFEMSDEQMKDTKYFGSIYGARLEKVLKDIGLEDKVASGMKKGDTLLWAAGLAHGGSNQKDRSLTRLSQVTHYYFEGAQSYWSPRTSRSSIDKIFYRDMTPCFYNERIPTKHFSCADLKIAEWKKTFDVKKDEL